MKSAILALAASLVLVVPAFAQDASPGGGTPAAGQAGGNGGGGKGGKVKAAIESCRNEVKSQGARGADRKKAVMDCVSKEHPEMAGRMQCRQDAQAKGLSGDELKSFVRTCVKSHG